MFKKKNKNNGINFGNNYTGAQEFLFLFGQLSEIESKHLLWSYLMYIFIEAQKSM
jgi:hypothetical protein